MRHLGRAIHRASRAEAQRDRLRLQVGALQARITLSTATSPRDAEFQVFSQFGEDGIIQYLLSKARIEDDVFVELGVGSYRESNTRFLLEHDNWRGLIVDGGRAHMRFVRQRDIGWRHTIRAERAFVTRENVDTLIRGAGISGDIGILSVDLDGNDYWIISAIEAVSPRILIAEYNSIFGPELPLTVPYDAEFRRDRAHSSHLYWGASISALHRVATDRGYVLVAGNHAGNNAFWVRTDVAGELAPIEPLQAWRPARFRESRSPSGALTYLASDRDRLTAIREMPLHRTDTGGESSIAEIFAV